MSIITIPINLVRVVEIREVEKESPTVKTFTFQDRLCGKAKPGQFLMVWIPGVDEVPMSLSAIRRDGCSAITVAEIGEATKALHKKKTGEKIGVRGPYGNGFTPSEGNVLIVAGGTGIAPLLPLIEILVKSSARITVIFGAGTSNELILLGRLEASLSGFNGKIIATTEDGSYGLRGLATHPMEELLRNERFDMVYTCGAEQMMDKVLLELGS